MDMYTTHMCARLQRNKKKGHWDSSINGYITQSIFPIELLYKIMWDKCVKLSYNTIFSNASKILIALCVYISFMGGEWKSVEVAQTEWMI